MAAYGYEPYYQDEHDIHDPLIPFYGIIPDRLRPGSVIKIKGECNTFASHFIVNLIVGQDIGAAAAGRHDIAFHFNPRWADDCVVKNSLQAGQWGQECREPHGVQPFSRMRNFKMEILVEDRCYRIAVDGHHFAEFVHRIPVEYVGMLNIQGDVEVKKIKFGNAPLPAIPSAIPDYGRQIPSAYPLPPSVPPTAYPSLYPQPGGGGGYPSGPAYPPPPSSLPAPVYPPPSSVPYPPVPAQPGYVPTAPPYMPPSSGSSPYPSHYPSGGGSMYPPVPSGGGGAGYMPYQPASYSDVDLKHPPTPFHYRFPTGLRAGGVIEILGAPTMYGQRFTIDLIRAQNVVVHTSVRLPERAVVRNSHYYTGGWEAEERDLPGYGSFEFAPQREFHLVYRVGGDRVEVTLNGQFLFTFRYRQPFDLLDAISIEGDVKLDDIRIEGQ